MFGMEATKEIKKDAVKSAKKQRGRAFVKGYDPRRWLGGRGKKSPEQKEGEKILLAVIWEELSREFDAASMTPLEQSATIDALRLMVRSLIRKKPEVILERIAGKVIEKRDNNIDGNIILEIVQVDARQDEYQ